MCIKDLEIEILQYRVKKIKHKEKIAQKQVILASQYNTLNQYLWKNQAQTDSVRSKANYQKYA